MAVGRLNAAPQATREADWVAMQGSTLGMSISYGFDVGWKHEQADLIILPSHAPVKRRRKSKNGLDTEHPNMAEGLGLAASVIAVLQLTGSIVSLTYHCGRDMWDAKGDSNRLRVEAEALQKVLQAAEKLVEDDAARKPAALRFPVLGALLTQDPDGLAKLCAEEVAGVQQALLMPWMAWNMTLMQQTSMGRGLLERAKWPLKKKRLESALEGIGRLQDAIVQAMATDTSRTTADIKTTVDRIDTTMSSLATVLGDIVHATGETHESLLVIRSRQAEEAARMAQDREREAAIEAAQRTREERETILQRLEAPEQARASQYAKYANLRDQRDKETSRWLLDGPQLAALLRPQALGPSMLWLKGSAGCGKTMLAAAVLEHLLAKRPDAALAYFFFDFNNSETSTSGAMLRSLAVQLVGACDVPLPAVVTKFAAAHLDQSGKMPPSVDSILRLLRDLVQHLALHTTRDVIIILDALDECTDRSILLQRLGHVLQWDLPLRIFMTSHDLPDVAALLDTNTNASTSVVTADSSNLSGDIDLFVRHQLETDPDLTRWPSETKQKIHRSLTSGAGGMFRKVSCEFEMLRSSYSEEDVNTALVSMPTTLSATYTAALRRVLKTKLRRTLRVLLWLLVGRGSALSPEATSEYLAVDLSDHTAGTEGACYFKPTRRMLEPHRTLPLLCPVLLRVDVVQAHGRTNSVLRLAHSTVRDYLLHSGDFLEAFGTDLTVLSAALSSSRSLGILEVAHAHVCKTLLAYMLSQPEPAGQCIQLHWDMSSYAASHWLYHYKLAAPAQAHDAELRDLVVALFTRNGVDDFGNYGQLSRLLPPVSRRALGRPCSQQLLVACAHGLDVVVEKLLPDELRDDCADMVPSADPAKGHGIGLDSCLLEAARGGHTTVVRLLLALGSRNVVENFGSTAGGLYRSLVRYTNDPKTFLELMLPYVQDEELEKVVYLASDRYDVSVRPGKAARDILPVLATRLPGFAFFAALGWDRCREVARRLCPPGNRFAAACLSGQTALARQLVETGEVDVRRPLWTAAGWEAYPLFLSVYAGECEVAAACLSRGALVDQVGHDASFFRPLSLAVWAGQLDLVTLLVDHGAAINAVCSMYGTPLQTAVVKRHHDVTKYLLDQPGIDVRRTACQNPRFAFSHMHAYWTPLQIATDRNGFRIAKLLLPRDPDAIWTEPTKSLYAGTGAADLRWEVPAPLLAMASRNGNVELVRLLLGAFKQQSQKSLSPMPAPQPAVPRALLKRCLRVAFQRGRMQVRQELINAGADPADWPVASAKH